MVAFDEVYGRSSKLRARCEELGLAYVAIIPCDFAITTRPGAVIRADEAVKDAVFERRSCGTGSKGPRISDWALVATASQRHFLLIRRLISRPDQCTFYLCWAPEDRAATLTCFITITGRRWPVEETFKTAKDVLGWDQCQARTWDAICRHTALAAFAQLRQVAIRNALYGFTRLPGTGKPAPGGPEPGEPAEPDDADLRIPLGDSPVPAYAGQPRPHQLGMINLSVAEASRLTRLAGEFAAGVITRAVLAFALRWSARRRPHQAIARWHHHNTRLIVAAS